ncbi:MAG: GntR family transcriptional regulator, partial [Roseiarcus sp.]
MANSATERLGLAGTMCLGARAGEDGGEIKPPRLARITHVTLYEKVYEELRDALMSGRFLPGEPLTFRGVADALGTSVMPVREALRRLAAERAVQFHADRSIRIPLLDEQSFDELLQMRLLLEGRAAALAAQRITRSDFDEALAFNLAFADAPGDGAPAARLLANRQFHFSIYRTARSPLLFSLIEMMWLQSGPYLMAPMRWRATRSEASSYFAAGVVHHGELLDALTRGDAAAAASAVQADIRDAAEAYRD